MSQPAPAAPATPAAPAPAPAPAAPQGVFDAFAAGEPHPSEATPSAPAARAAAAVPEPAPAPEPATPEPPIEAPATDTEAPAPAEGQPPAPAPVALETLEVKTHDGRSVKVPELVSLYEHSSREALKVVAANKEYAAKAKEYEVKIQQLELEKSLGPVLPDLTKEQEEAMTPAQISAHHSKQLEAKIMRGNAEKELKLEQQNRAAAADKLGGEIIALGRSMEADDANYPGYKELRPLMQEVMDLEPGVTGWPQTPKILFYAAEGMRSLRVKAESAKATATAAEKAKLKGTADATRTGGPGPTGAVKTPAGTATKAPAVGSDEAHNLAMIAAWKRTQGSVFTS